MHVILKAGHKNLAAWANITVDRFPRNEGRVWWTALIKICLYVVLGQPGTPMDA